MPNDVGAASAPRDIQSVFLNGARRERLEVTIHLTNGTRLDGRIKSFDRFAVVVDRGGSDELIFKHAIALIRPRQGGQPASSRAVTACRLPT